MLIRSELITAPASEQVTLSEAKTHLRIEHSDDDTFITSLIGIARDEAESVCNRRFGSQTWKLYFNGFQDIKLHGCGSVSEATMYYRDLDGDWVQLSSDLYEFVKAVPAYVFWKDSFNIPDTGDYGETVRVDVTCGETAAKGVKAWMLVRIGTLYENREADAERRVEPQTFVPNLLAGHRVIDYS